jgi:RNA polymerase sigma factor (sigma-70 family)
MDDQSLLTGLQQQNSACQLQFWNHYWTKVYAICVRILGKGPDATDLAVDLLTEFMDTRVQFVEKASSMGAYLRLMTVRRALDHKKKRARMSELTFDINDNTTASPEDRAAVTILMPRLEYCLPRLTEKAQQALRLKYTEQWSNERIGSFIGGSRQYISRLVRQSLSLLRSCIEKGGRKALAMD